MVLWGTKIAWNFQAPLFLRVYVLNAWCNISGTNICGLLLVVIQSHIKHVRTTFLQNAKCGMRYPPPRSIFPTPCPPSPDKSEAVPLTDRWSPQLTDRAIRFMFSGHPEPAAVPARGAARRRGSHFEGRCDTTSHRGDRRTALMMAFFLHVPRIEGWSALRCTNHLTLRPYLIWKQIRLSVLG